MSINTPLFSGKIISLGAIDRENDPAIETRWTHDEAFGRMFPAGRLRPLSVFQIKKKYEEIEKEVDEQELFHFRIRAKEDSRLLGFGEIYWIAWPAQVACIRLGIGLPEDRRKGYGREALLLLLNYAFMELNLHRLSAIIPEYNLPAIELFKSAGFVEEVRRREVFARDGHRWDSLRLGLLAADWKKEHIHD